MIGKAHAIKIFSSQKVQYLYCTQFITVNAAPTYCELCCRFYLWSLSSVYVVKVVLSSPPLVGSYYCSARTANGTCFCTCEYIWSLPLFQGFCTTGNSRMQAKRDFENIVQVATFRHKENSGRWYVWTMSDPFVSKITLQTKTREGWEGCTTPVLTLLQVPLLNWA